MEVLENEELFDTGINETFGIAAAIPLIKNLSYLAEEKTDISTAAQNVVSDTFVVGAGMSIGSAIGAAIDPIGTFVGAVGGAYIVKKAWDSFKVGMFCEEEEAQLELSLIHI